MDSEFETEHFILAVLTKGVAHFGRIETEHCNFRKKAHYIIC